MSDEPVNSVRRHDRLWLLGAILAAGIFGALAGRWLEPAPSPTSPQASRPIVQIVRQPAGPADLSDVVDRLCPSLATIVPAGTDQATSDDGSPAFAVSADGWLVTSALAARQGQAEAIFGDGSRAPLTDIRTDAVSGLTIVKAQGLVRVPLPASDEAWARVGQFGFSLRTPRGMGCSLEPAIVESDFLADGESANVGYLRVQASPERWAAGLPFLTNDGRLLGIATASPAGAVIPTPVAAIVIDELIRDQLAPSTDFGFRAIDFGTQFASRLGALRSGVGVALVQPKSAAQQAGLLPGDVITAVDDNPVSSASELNRSLDAQANKVTLTVQRGAERMALTVVRSPS